MNYVRNAWYVAAWSHEIGETPFAIAILDEPIALYRGESGRLVALADRCVHRMAPLSLGRCEKGDRLRCMYHGLLFAPDGQVVEIPGQEQVPPNARVRSYPVVERHSWVWVWMGEASEADEALIPPAVGLDDPDYILGHGHLDYEAEARLINDNLLDFSHLTFVHANSFGSGPEFADRQAKISPLERGIRYQRWVENSTGGNTRKSAAPLDNYMTYDFLLPGVLLMTGGAYPLGTAKACGFGEPDRAQVTGGVTFTSQAVTPTSEKTSRYFFSWGPHRDHGDEAMRDGLMALAAQAFEEDRVMIEAQQKVIDRTPDPTIMPTAHDKGVTMFNRLVERLVRSEREGTRSAA